MNKNPTVPREYPRFDDDSFVLPTSFDYNKFAHAIIGQDDVGSIIRCHFEAERTITHVLEFLTAGRYVHSKDRYMSQRIELCQMLGVCEDYLRPFKSLNTYRNDFAHKGKDTIESQFAERLLSEFRAMYPPFSSEFKMTIQKAGFDKKLSECDPKETVGIVCMMMCCIFALIPNMNQKYWAA